MFNSSENFSTSTPKSSIRPEPKREAMEQSITHTEEVVQQENVGTTTVVTERITSTSVQLEGENDESIRNETSYTSSSGGSGGYTVGRHVTSGPSSYQAMFGYKSRGSAGYGRNSRRYGVEGSISAVSVDATFAQMPNILSTRSEEKEELGVLNNRFATYIDKVRRLEAQNKQLNSRIVELESTKVTKISKSGDIYDDELSRLRREIEHLTHGKAEVEIQLHNCWLDLAALEKKFLAERNGKADADKIIISLRKDIDNATLTRIDLERKIETLREELELTKATNEADIQNLQTQVSVKHVDVTNTSFGGPSTDLTESLREIRVAYDKLTQNNTQDIEHNYKSTIADLQLQIKTINLNYSDCKSKLMDAQRQLQVVTVEIDGLRSTNSSLEMQISELQDRHEKDSQDYQDRIAQLEAELQSARDKMARHLADYNQLMNLKLSLDLEIATYRKLLEGEEGRISEAAAILDQNSFLSTTEKSVTVTQHTVSTSSNKSGGPLIIREKEIIREKGSSSSSSSSSDSD